MNAIEGGAGTVSFASGMGAITSAMMCFLSAGDHIVSDKLLDVVVIITLFFVQKVPSL